MDAFNRHHSGLVNQVAYTFFMQKVMEPFTKDEREKTFEWTEAMEEACTRPKE